MPPFLAHPPTHPLVHPRFHDVVPQDGLPMLPPSALSQLVVNRAKRTGGCSCQWVVVMWVAVVCVPVLCPS